MRTRPITIALGTRRVAALTAGPADAPAVVFVPGYTGSKEDFAPLLDPLAEGGFRVVAIDQPGQFESPGLDAAADHRPDVLGAVVRDIARSLGGRVRLVGHSFGGLVARAAAIAEPGLFDSLVLLSSGPAGLTGARRTALDRLEPVLVSHGLAGVYAAMQAAAGTDPDFRAPSVEQAQFLERRFLAGSPEALKGMADALRHEPDRVAELAATGVRVLVVHGADDDAWLPAEQADMADRLGAAYVVIPHAAHSAAVENPVATSAALIGFWAD